MAGDHGKPTLHEDPAFVRYATLNTNRYRYFRWTPRTAKFTFLYVAVIPTVLGYLAFATDGKWEFRGKKRGDPIREF
ncbi:hypothetical protein BZA05DRAFT_386608 [Tricharina praecox]|uniref:uncharacterized protein n=1 Tax=Tricharina praecox TaxID=43433 RepID=UPI00221F3AB0|nr:uncharacterized protein BZA05DRAFT_386608 [Tricharina praecox]KAI5856920.1 hypothetical protein BZA05DRAFT_386608 [Tricharina praecox]